MKWVTRRKARADRIACPWLIQRFIDPDAELLFAPEDQVMDTARREGALPFDVPGVELGHHGERCSFDAFIDKYGLTDPALQALALIVRGADTDARGITKEAWGLYAVASGFREISRDDARIWSCSSRCTTRSTPTAGPATREPRGTPRPRRQGDAHVLLRLPRRPLPVYLAEGAWAPSRSGWR